MQNGQHPDGRARDPGSGLLVIPLDRLPPRAQALVGGKAANLGRMLRAGLPVPPGFCVTTAAFRLWRDGCDPAARMLTRIGGLVQHSGRELCEIAGDLRERLRRVPVPAAVADQIGAMLQQTGPNLARAVRSSATVEDLPGASFAGQYDSALNVCGAAAVIEALRGCWLSLFSDRACACRQRNGIPHATASMGVVVQEMVPAVVSGVLFTADPGTGGAGRLVIETTRGLGEALVAGRVNPERWVVDRGTLQVVQQVPGGESAAQGARPRVKP